MKPLYLIDGSSYIYRAFYAMRALSTSAGMPTNAVYIFSRMLLKLLSDQQPENIAFVMDSRGPTFRHETYDEYKATRQRMPEDLQVQVPYIIEVVKALGIPTVQREGFEADDIMATLSRAYAGEVFLVTGDKDLMQLVNERVTVWDTLQDKRFDAAAVEKKFGVGPEYIADLLALMGDSSDNVPGVPGIGAKGAVNLITAYGHVEDILAHAPEVTAKRQREGLTEHADKARLSHDLVRLDRDCPLDVTADALVLSPRNVDRLVELFQELEFRALVEELGGAEAVAPPAEVEAEIIHGVPESIPDTVGLYVLPGAGAALCFDHTVHIMDEHEIPWGRLEEVVIHDAKEIIVPVLKRGLTPEVRCFDTMLAAYCVDAATGQAKLEDLSSSLLGRNIPTLKDLTGNGRGARNLLSLDTEECDRFLALHAEVLMPLKLKLEEQLKETGTESVYTDIELGLMPVLAQMEATGVLINPGVLRVIANEIGHYLFDLERDIYALAGHEFNINSTRQLGVVLFEEMGLPVVKKTKTGYSTDSRVLETLAPKHELPAKVVDYRGLTKLKNTYVDTLPGMIEQKSGRIHSHFNQAVTATGRISSSEPNLQNIPVRTDMGRRIREAFVAPEGHVMLSADYSQIELRILAHITDDAVLKESFLSDLDIHARTAAEVFNLPLDEVTADQRRAAKTINFGIIYGMGPHKLAGELGIRQSTAKEYIENYLAKYPGVQAYMESVVEQAQATGYVTTLFGRRRSIPEINSRNFNVREGAKRIAVNTPIQGTAADVIKIAMIRIQNRIAGMNSRMVLQVHDELVFDARLDELDALKALVIEEMENACPLSVPLKVDAGTGPSWAEAH